jgi:phenylpropionate dioxygenase-like ring-hydroxylating dioxygenase large terminal subunit
LFFFDPLANMPHPDTLPPSSNSASHGLVSLAEKVWPKEGFTRAPYWAYTNAEVYGLEQKKIFRGPNWHYVGLEVEVPEAGCFKSTYIGEQSVILTRAEDMSLSVMVNRCAHRGNMVTIEPFGKTKKLYCVYHAWSYTLKGDLSHAAFSQGLRGEGGLPKDFKLEEHGLQKLRVATLCGLVFATFSEETPALEEWLGEVATGIKRVLKKPLKVLGYDTQRIHANWKAYHENPRDSYHANILHTFYGTFGLSRMSQESGMVLEDAGRHVYFYTKAGTEKKSTDYDSTSSQLRSHNDGLRLEDPSILKWTDEFNDGVSVQILTTYPGFVLHQIANSLATRQICTKGPGQTDLVWTYFGFADDDEEMTNRRLVQTNLAGSAGMISVEDAAVCEMMQHAMADAQEGESFIEMGGKDLDIKGSNKLSERAIRNFWNHYRMDTGL